METWKELQERLPENLPDEVIELVRRLTAPDRHKARVEAARRAAYVAANRSMSSADRAAAMEKEDGIEGEITRRAAILAALEVVGFGGPFGMGAPQNAAADCTARKTIRARWAAHLGKGRAHASDGPAWTAAIAEVAQAAPYRLNPQELVWAVGICPDQCRAYARREIARAAEMLAVNPENGSHVAAWHDEARALIGAWAAVMPPESVESEILHETFEIEIELPKSDEEDPTFEEYIEKPTQ